MISSVNLKLSQHSSKRKKQSVKLRILLNECKDCVGAWVLQITGTGVGTLSEDRIYSQSNLCLPHIAKQTFGRRGRIDYFVTLFGLSQRAIGARLCVQKSMKEGYFLNPKTDKF